MIKGLRIGTIDGLKLRFTGEEVRGLLEERIDADTQEIKWRERTGAGTLMVVGSQLVVLGDGTGELLIADFSPEKFTLRHRVRVLPDGVRAVTGAAFADGRFYIRNLRELVAFRLG